VFAEAFSLAKTSNTSIYNLLSIGPERSWFVSKMAERRLGKRSGYAANRKFNNIYQQVRFFPTNLLISLLLDMGKKP